MNPVGPTSLYFSETRGDINLAISPLFIFFPVQMLFFFFACFPPKLRTSLIYKDPTISIKGNTERMWTSCIIVYLHHPSCVRRCPATRRSTALRGGGGGGLPPGSHSRRLPVATMRPWQLVRFLNLRIRAEVTPSVFNPIFFFNHIFTLVSELAYRESKLHQVYLITFSPQANSF